MNQSTLKKWKRDALEDMHNFRDDPTPNARDARRHANRVVTMVDLILSSITHDAIVLGDVDSKKQTKTD